jgi:hypothetical protein
VYKLLSPQDIAALLPDIVAAIRTPAPSGEMFAYGIRLAGLDLLSRLRIREGMPMCADIMNEFRWGRPLNQCVDALARYGGAAREVIARVRDARQTLVDQDKDWETKNNDRRRDILALDKLITQIEADRNPPALRSLEDFLRAPAASN